MKVKTYSVNTFDAWLQTEGDDITGSYVKYEDFAALAAECAALKSAIEFAEPWLPACDEELLNRIEIAKQTPATDAYLAGIKAEALPANIAEIIDSGDLETICYESERSYAEDFRLAFYNFRQLREGAK